MNQEWQSAIISHQATIFDAVKIIDVAAMKTGIVVDQDEVLVGIVTDGDVRRALLNGCSMHDNVLQILNRNPVVGSPQSSRSERIALMQKDHLVSLPIVDERRRVVSLDLLAKIITKTEHGNPVFLMADGDGKRLRPLTDDISQPLTKISGKPLLETILERFVKCGFKNFYISVNCLENNISEHFGDGSRWGVNIEYIPEESPLGTAGALSLLPLEKFDLPLVLMNSDLITNVNFDNLLEFHKQSKAAVTVAVRQCDFQVPYGVLNHQEGKITEIIEKPVQQFFVNAGIYVLEPAVYNNLGSDSGYLDMPTLLNRLVNDNIEVTMFPIHEHWLDIGKVNDFEKAKREFEHLDSL